MMLHTLIQIHMAMPKGFVSSQNKSEKPLSFLSFTYRWFYTLAVSLPNTVSHMKSIDEMK